MFCFSYFGLGNITYISNYKEKNHPDLGFEMNLMCFDLVKERRRSIKQKI